MKIKVKTTVYEDVEVDSYYQDNSLSICITYYQITQRENKVLADHVRIFKNGDCSIIEGAAFEMDKNLEAITKAEFQDALKTAIISLIETHKIKI